MADETKSVSTGKWSLKIGETYDTRGNVIPEGVASTPVGKFAWSEKAIEQLGRTYQPPTQQQLRQLYENYPGYKKRINPPAGYDKKSKS